MATLNLLYKQEYAINEHIKIQIPTVGEVLDNEDDYYTMVTMLTAMPVDMMVQLDDIGVDFTAINEYELFLILFNALKDKDTSLIFGELDLKPFRSAVNPQNNTIVLRNKETGVVIDRGIQGQIASVLRKIHNLKRNNRKPANQEAREYMLQRAREKMRRRSKRMNDSLNSSTMDSRGHENSQSISLTKVCDRLSKKLTMTTGCTVSMLARSMQKNLAKTT